MTHGYFDDLVATSSLEALLTHVKVMSQVKRISIIQRARHRALGARTVVL